jgi:branched-subunit amino acid aminotransferase/4-amino-4-deoxychorismate lyase
MSSWKKISPACLPIHTKTLQCLNSVLSRGEAEENGCFEALLMSEKGHVCECSSANIFWFKGNTLYTPSVESGILPGTTRAAIIRLSPYKVVEGIYSLEDMLSADEIFLSNVTLKTCPVGEIAWDASKRWNNHPKTQEIHQLMMEDIARYVAANHVAMA